MQLFQSYTPPSNAHNLKIEVNKVNFTSIAEFKTWKEEEEIKLHANYVQECAPQSSSIKQTWYYYCNHSGIYRETGKGIRNTKRQGSSKTGQRCTAHMKVVNDTDTGEVTVHYCSTHYKHEISMGHLRIQEATRLNIAAQLQEGVTRQRIMDNIRDSVTFGITREHLVTKQDIYNIKNQYNIEGVMHHINDLTSVCAWVKEFETLPYNPIIIFKPQG